MSAQSRRRRRNHSERAGVMPGGQRMHFGPTGLTVGNAEDVGAPGWSLTCPACGGTLAGLETNNALMAGKSRVGQCMGCGAALRIHHEAPPRLEHVRDEATLTAKEARDLAAARLRYPVKRPICACGMVARNAWEMGASKPDAETIDQILAVCAGCGRLNELKDGALTPWTGEVPPELAAQVAAVRLAVRLVNQRGQA